MHPVAPEEQGAAHLLLLERAAVDLEHSTWVRVRVRVRVRLRVRVRVRVRLRVRVRVRVGVRV